MKMSKQSEIAYRIRRCIAETKPEDMESEWGFSWEDLEAFLEERKWIPCEKSLPEKPMTCLVTVDDRDGELITDVDMYSATGWKWNLLGFVKAWMPCPEPYHG